MSKKVNRDKFGNTQGKNNRLSSINKTYKELPNSDRTTNLSNEHKDKTNIFDRWPNAIKEDITLKPGVRPKPPVKPLDPNEVKPPVDPFPNLPPNEHPSVIDRGNYYGRIKKEIEAGKYPPALNRRAIDNLNKLNKVNFYKQYDDDVGNDTPQYNYQASISGLINEDGTPYRNDYECASDLTCDSGGANPGEGGSGNTQNYSDIGDCSFSDSLCEDMCKAYCGGARSCCNGGNGVLGLDGIHYQPLYANPADDWWNLSDQSCSDIPNGGCGRYNECGAPPVHPLDCNTYKIVFSEYWSSNCTQGGNVLDSRCSCTCRNSTAFVQYNDNDNQSPPIIEACLDSDACNYGGATPGTNSDAGTYLWCLEPEYQAYCNNNLTLCNYDCYGCTNPTATNYVPTATRACNSQYGNPGEEPAGPGYNSCCEYNEIKQTGNRFKLNYVWNTTNVKLQGDSLYDAELNDFIFFTGNLSTAKAFSIDWNEYPESITPSLENQNSNNLFVDFKDPITYLKRVDVRDVCWDDDEYNPYSDDNGTWRCCNGSDCGKETICGTGNAIATSPSIYSIPTPDCVIYSKIGIKEDIQDVGGMIQYEYEKVTGSAGGGYILVNPETGFGGYGTQITLSLTNSAFTGTVDNVYIDDTYDGQYTFTIILDNGGTFKTWKTSDPNEGGHLYGEYIVNSPAGMFRGAGKSYYEGIWEREINANGGWEFPIGIDEVYCENFDGTLPEYCGIIKLTYCDNTVDETVDNKWSNTDSILPSDNATQEEIDRIWKNVNLNRGQGFYSDYPGEYWDGDPPDNWQHGGCSVGYNVNENQFAQDGGGTTPHVSVSKMVTYERPDDYKFKYGHCKTSPTSYKHKTFYGYYAITPGSDTYITGPIIGTVEDGNYGRRRRGIFRSGVLGPLIQQYEGTGSGPPPQEGSHVYDCAQLIDEHSCNGAGSLYGCYWNPGGLFEGDEPRCSCGDSSRGCTTYGPNWAEQNNVNVNYSQAIPATDDFLPCLGDQSSNLHHDEDNPSPDGDLWNECVKNPYESLFLFRSGTILKHGTKTNHIENWQSGYNQSHNWNPGIHTGGSNGTSRTLRQEDMYNMSVNPGDILYQGNFPETLDLDGDETYEKMSLWWIYLHDADHGQEADFSWYLPGFIGYEQNRAYWNNILGEGWHDDNFSGIDLRRLNGRFDNMYRNDHVEVKGEIYKYTCFDYYDGRYLPGGEEYEPCRSGDWTINSCLKWYEGLDGEYGDEGVEHGDGYGSLENCTGISTNMLQFGSKRKNLMIPQKIQINYNYESLYFPFSDVGAEVIQYPNSYRLKLWVWSDEEWDNLPNQVVSSTSLVDIQDYRTPDEELIVPYSMIENIGNPFPNGNSTHTSGGGNNFTKIQNIESTLLPQLTDTIYPDPLEKFTVHLETYVRPRADGQGQSGTQLICDNSCGIWIGNPATDYWSTPAENATFLAGNVFNAVTHSPIQSSGYTNFGFDFPLGDYFRKVDIIYNNAFSGDYMYFSESFLNGLNAQYSFQEAGLPFENINYQDTITNMMLLGDHSHPDSHVGNKWYGINNISPFTGDVRDDDGNLLEGDLFSRGLYHMAVSGDSLTYDQQTVSTLRLPGCKFAEPDGHTDDIDWACTWDTPSDNEDVSRNYMLHDVYGYKNLDNAGSIFNYVTFESNGSNYNGPLLSLINPILQLGQTWTWQHYGLGSETSPYPYIIRGSGTDFSNLTDLGIGFQDRLLTSCIDIDEFAPNCRSTSDFNDCKEGIDRHAFDIYMYWRNYFWGFDSSWQDYGIPQWDSDDVRDIVLGSNKWTIDLVCKSMGFDAGKVLSWRNSASGCSNGFRRVEFEPYYSDGSNAYTTSTPTLFIPKTDGNYPDTQKTGLGGNTLDQKRGRWPDAHREDGQMLLDTRERKTNHLGKGMRNINSQYFYSSANTLEMLFAGDDGEIEVPNNIGNNKTYLFNYYNDPEDFELARGYGARLGNENAYNCPTGDNIRPADVVCYNHDIWSPAQNYMYGETNHNKYQPKCDSFYNREDFLAWYKAYYFAYFDRNMSWKDAYDHPLFGEEVPYMVSTQPPNVNVTRECGPEIVVLPATSFFQGSNTKERQAVYPGVPQGIDDQIYKWNRWNWSQEEIENDEVGAFLPITATTPEYFNTATDGTNIYLQTITNKVNPYQKNNALGYDNAFTDSNYSMVVLVSPGNQCGECPEEESCVVSLANGSRCVSDTSLSDNEIFGSTGDNIIFEDEELQSRDNTGDFQITIDDNLRRPPLTAL